MALSDKAFQMALAAEADGDNEKAARWLDKAIEQEAKELARS